MENSYEQRIKQLLDEFEIFKRGMSNLSSMEPHLKDLQLKNVQLKEQFTKENNKNQELSKELSF